MREISIEVEMRQKLRADGTIGQGYPRHLQTAAARHLHGWNQIGIAGDEHDHIDRPRFGQCQDITPDSQTAAT